jgi:hypothetical protein
VIPQQYLDALTTRLAEALGGSLRGVYLLGSGATGEYRQGTSDIDVMAVVDCASRTSLEAVVAACAHEALLCPATKLELVVYELGALARDVEHPQWSLNLNTGEGVHHVGFDPANEPAHWFVLDLAAARVHAVPLAGPPAAALIPPVSDGTIAGALDEMVDWYERNEPEHAAAARARADAWRTTRSFAAKPRGYPPLGTPP